MIKIRNLKKSFGQKEIISNLNLDIVDGKTTAILGHSGSGKSTIIKMIVKLIEPNSGEISIDNINICKMKYAELQEMRKNIGFLFQNGALFDSMDIFDNIAFPLREHTKFSESDIKKQVFAKLDMVGLDPSRVSKLFPDELSGGMKKRAGLARSIMLNPKIILYDEPTSGLDPVTSKKITQMIIDLQQEIKATSILISHDINETLKASDYVAMLYKGEIIKYDSIDNFIATKDENLIISEFMS